VTYLVASTYIGLAIVIGLFLFVIPGLIVMAVTYLTPIYILKHAQGPIEAVASSASAMRDCILPVMALFLGLSFLEAGIEMCLTYAADMIELPNIIAQLVIAGIGIIASLFMLTLMVKVYVRVSQEA
jgi:amino acid transporter